MPYKAVLIHVDPDDWEVFREIVGNYKLSAGVRALVKAEIDRYTREETKAQSLAGLTEA